MIRINKAGSLDSLPPGLWHVTWGNLLVNLVEVRPNWQDIQTGKRQSLIHDRAGGWLSVKRQELSFKCMSLQEPDTAIAAKAISYACTVIAVAVFSIVNNITRKAIVHGRAG